MNKNKTIYLNIFIILITAFSALSASEKTTIAPYSDVKSEVSTEEPVKNSFGYASLGVKPYIVPNFNLGYRTQNNRVGFDSSVGISAILFDYPLFTANLTPLFYPNPTVKGAQSYFGLGVTAGALLEHWKVNQVNGYIGPSFVFGREFLTDQKNRQFFQFSIDALFDIKTPVWSQNPVAAFSFAYGWGF